MERGKLLNVLIEWNRVLKLGGLLRIAVPDFKKVAEVYINKNVSLPTLIGFLNGGQKNEWDFHYLNFDFETLTNILKICGFDNFEIYLPDDFLEKNDDYSKSYLPHMDPTGDLMSLNILCRKVKNQTIDQLNNENISEKYQKYLKYTLN